MNHIAIAAAATAMLIGAGAGAVSPAAEPKEAPGVMNPTIGGQAMLSTRDIVENMAASPEHTVFVAALKDAGLSDTLKGKGPYTVFAPTNEALTRSAATEQKLAKSADYFIVKGKLDSQALLRMINETGGQVTLKTLDGGTLVATMNGPTNIVLIDQKGNQIPISTYDVYDANGVTHVIDKVMQAG